MNVEKAIEIIENLRDYAYENWKDDTYGEELEEIARAVDLIKSALGKKGYVGSAEIGGKRYLIFESED